MPDLRTLQNLIDRIADEIKTDDLAGSGAGAANIYNAVQDAVIHYQREHLFANDAIDTSIMTVAGQETYLVPDTLISITELNLLANATRYEVREISIDELTDLRSAQPTQRGLIYKYTFYNTDTGNGAIMVWPAPSADGWLFEFLFQARIPMPAALTESNFWTTVGETLIRNRAKWALNLGVLRDPESAQLDKALEQEALSNLLLESVQKQSTGTLRATRL